MFYLVQTPLTITWWSIGYPPLLMVQKLWSKSYGPRVTVHNLTPLWTQMGTITSDIELMEVELFRNCWIFFLKFSDFRSDIVYLVNQNHHLHLIITHRSFKSLFRKFNIINMIPLLHQICDISLIPAVSVWALKSHDVIGTIVCAVIVDWALSWFDRK